MKLGSLQIFVSILLAFQLGCSHFKWQQPETLESVDPAKKAAQEAQVQTAEAALDQQNWQQAEDLFKNFLKQYPYSVFLQRARFGLAQSFEEQGNWSEAADLYRTIIKTSQSINPEIAAQAHFAVSFCYENLGDEPKVLASLQDAQNLQEYLTPEKANAEIPARMAASYYRIGRAKEAEDFLKKADEGIKLLRASKVSDKDRDWLAKIYFKMGVFSTNQLNDENLVSSLDTLRVVQIFSLRSAEEAIQPWSYNSSERLIENYQSIWRVIRNLSAESSMEAGMAKYELEQKQIELCDRMLEMINDLKQYQLPGTSSKSEATKKIFSFIEELKKQAQIFIANKSIRNHLTPEAESLGGLKR